LSTETAIASGMITLYVLSAVITISEVGKPRQPMPGSTAAVSTVIAALLILGVLYLLEH
jgi:hypothetical protein